MKKYNMLTKGVYFIMKILTNTQYDALIEVARDAQKTIDSLRSEITVYEAIVKKLQKENNSLKEALRSKTVFVDFPNSHPVSESDTRDQWR